MASPSLVLTLLVTICLSLGSILEPSYQGWSERRNKSANILDMLIGDSRQMFANHFFAKADAYFHSGYYPSIFDGLKKEETHLAGCEDHDHEEGDHDEHCEKEGGGFLGEPKDWIDEFSRNFFSSRHFHLEKDGEERELLPWLRLSAQLDPHKTDTYTIASYWLRSRLGKVNEAEQFLREGLRANPDSYEIYYELGRIYNENKHDPRKARNLWEVALRKWNAQLQYSEKHNNPAAKPNELVYEGITARLAKLEEEQGNLEQAIYYFKLVKEKSPNPGEIQKQIDEIQARTNSSSKK